MGGYILINWSGISSTFFAFPSRSIYVLGNGGMLINQCLEMESPLLPI